MGCSNITIYDIAKQAGVSVATVSRVINKSCSVKPETANRVLEIIEKNGFVPSATARNLSCGSSMNIGFVVPDIDNPFFSKILKGITDRASYYGYNVFMFGSNEEIETEHKILKSLSYDMIKGLMIIPVSQKDKISADHLKDFENNGVPVVLIDRDIDNYKFSGVFSEDEQGAYEAVSLFISEGYRDIAIISGPTSSRPGLNRLRGYKRALKDANIDLCEDYIISGEFKIKESYMAASKLFELKHPPQAVFTSNNLSTLGLLQYMKKQNKILGQDIAIIGFDDIDYLNLLDINITVVDRPVYSMGYQAMELLNNSFENNGVQEIVQRVYVKSWINKRGSEKALKKINNDKDY